MNIKTHFNLLGMRVEDRVTGFKGVATSISFDLYGCIQVVVNPGLDQDGKPRDLKWFDLNRLKVISDEPVMERPNFDFGLIAEGKHGPSEKPTGREIFSCGLNTKGMGIVYESETRTIT